jgi:hypothetical protein
MFAAEALFSPYDRMTIDKAVLASRDRHPDK